MKISWYCRASAGYGDIVSPLCYAQNQGEIYDTVVHLDMKWEFLKGNKFTPDHLITRIHRILDFPNVVLTHRYGCVQSNEDSNEALKRIDELDQMHNVYFPIDHVVSKHKVVCTPLNNKEPFDVYVNGIRSWKQALTNEQWLALSTEHNVIDIDYNTTIEDAIGILVHCDFFEGYHGSCSWLARLIGIPMKIHSGKPNLTNYCFPWRADTRKESLLLLEKCRTRRDEYIDDLRRARSKRTAGV